MESKKKTKIMFVTWTDEDDLYPAMAVPSVVIKHRLLLGICKIVGHNSYTKKGEYINDSGYPVCLRCGSHSYHNSEEWMADGFFTPMMNKIASFWWKITNPFRTCSVCHKPEWYGNHDNCIPF